MQRRTFLRQTGQAALLGGLSQALPARVWAAAPGANDALRIAVVGLHSQGKTHIEQYRKLPGVRLVALCDVDSAVLAERVDTLKREGVEVTPYSDVRKLLESREIDAVSFATPNHWHALMTIWACQAGKDVYVEKPMTHTYREGVQVVAAARKYERIVQHGTQRRSDPGWHEAIAWCRAGNLGKITLTYAFWYKLRDSIGRTEGPQPIPATVDYDLWCGPGPKGPLRRKSLHYDWHWFWDYGDGDNGNSGVHLVDVARWVGGHNDLPPRVVSVGQRYAWNDDGETPNSIFSCLEYPEIPIVLETRNLPIKTGVKADSQFLGSRVTCIIFCENGYCNGSKAYDKQGKVVKSFPIDGGGGHFGNFVKAVRSRKRTDLNAECVEGHLSTALVHLGNASYRLGAKATPEVIADRVKGFTGGSDAWTRFCEHLVANNIQVATDHAVLGPVLEWDNGRQQYSGPTPELAAGANAFLTRTYRKPFEVPEIV